MLDLVLLRGLPSAHLGKELHRAKLVGKFNLAALCVVGLRQSVIGSYFCPRERYARPNGRRARRPPTLVNPQQMLPVAKVTRDVPMEVYANV
jgi:hypothetical protein